MRFDTENSLGKVHSDGKNSLEKVQSGTENSLGKVRDGLSALISDSKNSKKKFPFVIVYLHTNLVSFTKTPV